MIRETALPAAQTPTPLDAAPLTCWVVTDGKAGDEGQCIGVANALGAETRVLRVAPRRPWSWLLPRGPLDPREAPGAATSPFQSPYPDVAIASGRRAVAYLAAIKRASAGRTLTVCLKDPRIGPRAADLIWVQTHDPLRGDNVLVTPTSPHRFSASLLKAQRATPLAEIESLPHPRIAVLVGGDSRHHRFSAQDQTRLLDGLRALAQGSGAGLMITASRRTPAPLAEGLARLAATGSHLMWDGSGDNPLPAYLANADAIVATADSTNMIGEAAATGRPIHVFHPTGGHAKIDRFLGTLREMGVIHPFPGPLKTTTYEPLDSTPLIAAAIRKALSRHPTPHAAGTGATEAACGPEETRKG